MKSKKSIRKMSNHKFGKCSLLLAAVALISLIVSGCGGEEYRTMKIYAISGNTNVFQQDIGDINAYESMVLNSGDVVSVKDGTTTICADSDKYLYAEGGTEFQLSASGSEQSGKMSIDLKSGAVTTEIQNKLTEESTFEINTPNSTMAVRGTVFAVSLKKDKGGKTVSELEVFNGTVSMDMLNKDGTVKETVSVEAGKGISIRTDADGNGYSEGIRDAKLTNLSESTIEYLLSINEEHGNDVVLVVGDTDLGEYYENDYESEEAIEYDDADYEGQYDDASEDEDSDDEDSDDEDLDDEDLDDEDLDDEDLDSANSDDDDSDDDDLDDEDLDDEDLDADDGSDDSDDDGSDDSYDAGSDDSYDAGSDDSYDDGSDDSYDAGSDDSYDDGSDDSYDDSSDDSYDDSDDGEY